MRRASRSPAPGRGILLAGLTAAGIMCASTPALALPLPQWASARIINAVETRLPFAITVAEDFSIGWGRSIGTLTIGIGRAGVRDPATGTSVDMQDTALSVGLLDLLVGTVAIESITIGHLDLNRGTGPPSGDDRPVWDGGHAMPDIRTVTGQLARLEQTLDQLVVESFTTDIRLPGRGLPLTLEGGVLLTHSGEGWRGDVAATARRGPARIGTVVAEFAVANAGDVPAIEVTIASDTSALGPVFMLPATWPVLQLEATLVPAFDSAGRLMSVAIALEGTGEMPDSQAATLASLVMNGVWRPGDTVLGIEHLAIESDRAHLAAHGTAVLEKTESGSTHRVSGSILIETLEVNLDRTLENPLPPTTGSLTFAIDLARGQDHFAEFQFTSPVTDGHVRYETEAEGRARLAVRIDALTVGELMAFWPAGVFANTRRWVASQVTGGHLLDFTGLFSIPAAGPLASQITFQFADLDFTPVRDHLPVQASKGHVALTEEEMEIVFAEGWVDVPDKGLIDLGASYMHIPRIRDASHPSVIHVHFTGDLAAVLDLINREPFAFMTKVNMSPDIATGATEGVVEVRIPLQTTVQPEDIAVTVRAVIKDLVAYGLWPGQSIRANYASVTADDNQITIAGEAYAGAVLMNADWHLVYDGSAHSVSGTVRLDEELLAQLRAPQLANYVSGNEEAMFRIDLTAPDAISYALTSPLTGLAIAIPEIGWRKDRGVAADFSAKGQIAPTLTVDQIRLQSSDLDFVGALRVAPGTGRVERISLSSVRLGRAYKGPAELAMGANGRLASIAAPGTLEIGALQADPARLATGSQRPVDVSIGTIVFSETIRITDARGQFGELDESDGLLQAKLNAAVPVRIGIERQEDGTRFLINADDASAVAKAIGLTGNLAGGTLAIDLTAEPRQGIYRGNLTVTDVTARKIPVLLSLLSTISLTGLIDQMDSGGISFYEVRGQFTVTPDSITISDGIANSSSIGLTAEGTYDLAGKVMDFDGSLTPNIYIGFALNTILPIGRLVGQREGEGLGTIRYTLRGPASNPTIETHALSILSPIGSGDLDSNN